MKKNQLRNIAFQSGKILLGLLLLLLSLRSVNWVLFKDAIRSVSLPLLAFVILSVLLSQGLKLWRWCVLLQNFQVQVPFLRLATAYFLGQAANILLVLRAGEVLRIGWIHQPQREDIVEITGTIALEKYLDLLLFVMTLLAVSSALPDITQRYLGPYQHWIVLSSLALLFVILLGPWLWRRVFEKIAWKGWMNRVANRLDTFVSASLWLRNPLKITGLILGSIVIWVVMGLTNWLLFRSLGLSLGWQAALTVLVLVYVGVLPALMPGNLGPFTYFAQLALLPFAVETSAAFAFAVLLYAIVNLPPLFLAGGTLLFSKVKINS
jgi:uncharacterized membrane protein YbhN (UPF0104 family)